MQPLTHTPGAVLEFSHADNIIDIWKEAIDVLSYAVFRRQSDKVAALSE